MLKKDNIKIYVVYLCLKNSAHKQCYILLTSPVSFCGPNPSPHKRSSASGLTPSHPHLSLSFLYHENFDNVTNQLAYLRNSNQIKTKCFLPGLIHEKL